MPTFEWKVGGAHFKAMKLSNFNSEFESRRWHMFDGAFYMKVWPNGYSRYSSQQGIFTGSVGLDRTGNEKFSEIGITFLISLIEMKQLFPLSVRLKPNGARCFSIKDATFALLQKCDKLTVKVEAEITFAMDAHGKDISYLYTDQTEEKQPDTPGYAEQEKLKQATFSSLQTKFDEFQTKMREIEHRLEVIELQMNSEQKTNVDEKYDNVMKEIQSMRAEMNAVPHHTNDISAGQQELKQWLEYDVGLPQYYNVFVENGIDDLTTAALLTMEPIKAMGIEKIGHQMKILNMVIKLKDNEADPAKTLWVIIVGAVYTSDWSILASHYSLNCQYKEETRI
eukprot:586730_1